MRRQGWNLRRDSSEKPIVQALRQAGCQVLRLDRFDLLVLTPHRGLYMLETKTRKGKATETQHASVTNRIVLEDSVYFALVGVVDALRAAVSR